MCYLFGCESDWLIIFFSLPHHASLSNCPPDIPLQRGRSQNWQFAVSLHLFLDAQSDTSDLVSKECDALVSQKSAWDSPSGRKPQN